MPQWKRAVVWETGFFVGLTMVNRWLLWICVTFAFCGACFVLLCNYQVLGRSVVILLANRLKKNSSFSMFYILKKCL